VDLETRPIRMSERDQPGRKALVVRVKKVADFGAFVELPNGQRGFIRRRELSWDENVRPQLVLQPESEIEVVFLGTDPVSGRPEFSYRQAVGDPWQEFLRLYKEGSTVRGKVKRLLPGGAFISILPGVDGWLPISQISFDRIEEIHQVLWLGDTVEAVVTEIDSGNRQISLSLRERLRQINREEIRQRIKEHGSDQSLGATISERTGISADALKARLLGPEGAASELPKLSGPHPAGHLKVLLIDDEPELRGPMSEWLRSWGCNCVICADGTSGCSAALAEDYDVIFLDIGLPDVNGVAVARKILAQKPHARIVMISGIALADKYMSELESLGIHTVLIKPLDPAEIEALLTGIALGDDAFRPPGILAMHPDHPSEVDFLAALTTGHQRFASVADALETALSRVRQATRAEAAAVFSMDPTTRAASLIAQDGLVEITYDSSKHPLEISPVRDVIIGHEYIFETDVRRREGKFRYLLPLVSFSSCIGVPIEAGGKIRHGLFLFHRQAEAFTFRDLQHAMAASLALGATIERAELDEIMLAYQNLSLQGQISAGLAHEINNKLSGILFKAQHLTDRCSDIELTLTDLSLSQQLSEVRRGLQEIGEMSSALRQTAHLFQNLMRAKSEGLADVNHIIRSAVEVVRPAARMNKVEIQSELSPNLPPVPASRIRLEQAFLNIMVNAIQHTAAFSPLGGTLRVSTSHDASGPRWPIKVRFRDDGPGIHRQLFDKIFDLGFTTRPDGSGLGLYITRGLIESIGGRISVEESMMLLGTTFLVELPAARGGHTP